MVAQMSKKSKIYHRPGCRFINRIEEDSLVTFDFEDGRKGLEFDYVFAVAVNKKVLPFGTRADFEDDISLEEFRTGEKCLLYVALTRARKSACVTCYGGLSELIV